jgi:predicted kinase
MKSTFLVGVSGSGKSTYAQKLQDCIIIERDEIRQELIQDPGFVPGVSNMWRFWRFNKKNESKVTELFEKRIELAVSEKQNIVFSSTNLNYQKLQSDIQKMKNFGYEVEVIPFHCDFDDVVKRDKKRANSVGYQVICKQWLQWINLPFEINGIKKYQKDLSKPKCILVDIDGTVAKMADRSPYDWDQVDQDEYIMEIVDLVLRYWRSHKVIFLSGRDSISREKTKNWLLKYFPIEDDQLLMRQEGNIIKDCIIKSDLFFAQVADNYCVDFVIDDRKQIVRKWNDIGLKVIDVGVIYDEF